MSCHCTDKNNNPKKLYLSEVEASHQRQYIKKHRGVDVEIYVCPVVKFGWHLTSKQGNNCPSPARFRHFSNKIKGNALGEILKSKQLAKIRHL
jgi:hypothetical protein